MEKEENLNIKVDFAAGETEKLLVIRHDNPKKDPDPEVVTLSGIITSPSEFVRKRGELVYPKKSHVVFSRTDLKIELVVNEDSKFKSVIVGQMVDHPLLKALRINKANPFTIESLKKVIQYEKSNFKDPDRFRSIIFQLENFKVKVNTTVEKFNNRETKEKGASVKKELSDATTDFNFNFTLYIPFFVGGNVKYDMPIEIGIEPGDSTVELYPEWDEYEKKREEAIDELWAQEMEYFKDFVIIEKS